MGARPKRKVEICWSADFAYSLGLLVTDGSLSKDGRHIDFTSKDKEQVEHFCNGLGIEGTKLSCKRRSRAGVSDSDAFYWHVQFSDVIFYRFLVSIGLMANKTKLLQSIEVPDHLFVDFLRGHFDGDGSFWSYKDKRWRNSFMFYTVFASASMGHLEWLRSVIRRLIGVNGCIIKSRGRATPELRYAKVESLKLLRCLYYQGVDMYLNRKYLKINQALATIGQSI